MMEIKYEYVFKENGKWWQILKSRCYYDIIDNIKRYYGGSYTYKSYHPRRHD
jgi:hypothetical protein